MTAAATHELAIDIGDMPILVRTDSAEFAALLEDRYGSFIKPQASSPQPWPPRAKRASISI